MKTIFFDWGGVIARDPGDHFLADLLRSIGANDKQVEDIFASYMRDFTRGKISEKQYWAAIQSHYGLTIHDTISEEFTKWQGLKADESILALVDEVKSRGYKVALFTNVIEPSYNLIKAAGFYDHFDIIVASCKVGYGKPDEEIYPIALQMAGATASESLFIDDRQNFLDPAAKLGFTTILAESSEQIIRDVRAYMDSHDTL